MLDLIVLYFLTKEIGRIALRKGLKPIRWKIYTIVSWLVSEIIGLIFGLMIFKPDNIFSIIMVALTFAITSYFIIKAQLNRLPDNNFDDDINNLGSSWYRTRSLDCLHNYRGNSSICWLCPAKHFKKKQKIEDIDFIFIIFSDKN